MKKFVLTLAVAAFVFCPLAMSAAQIGKGKPLAAKHVGGKHKHHGKHHHHHHHHGKQRKTG